MIYVTGDTHGFLNETLNRFAAAGVKEGDTVIVCGDFGFVMAKSPEYMIRLKKIAQEKYIILFIDGNHENFDMLEEYPIVEYCGGKTHKIADNIYHLMRGQIFEIEGERWFTFGGAYSVDKAMRTEGYSWWKQELPTKEDYDEARKNLEKAGYKVDYVLTHTVPDSIIHRLGKIPDMHDKELTGYLEWLYRELDFKMWFAGHWHMNRRFDKFCILHDSVLKVK